MHHAADKMSTLPETDILSSVSQWFLYVNREATQLPGQVRSQVQLGNEGGQNSSGSYSMGRFDGTVTRLASVSKLREPLGLMIYSN